MIIDFEKHTCQYLCTLVCPKIKLKRTFEKISHTFTVMIQSSFLLLTTTLGIRIPEQHNIQMVNRCLGATLPYSFSHCPTFMVATTTNFQVEHTNRHYACKSCNLLCFVYYAITSSAVSHNFKIFVQFLLLYSSSGQMNKQQHIQTVLDPFP